MSLKDTGEGHKKNEVLLDTTKTAINGFVL